MMSHLTLPSFHLVQNAVKVETEHYRAEDNAYL